MRQNKIKKLCTVFQELWLFVSPHAHEIASAIEHVLTGTCMGPCRYSSQPQQVFKDCASIFLISADEELNQPTKHLNKITTSKF